MTKTKTKDKVSTGAPTEKEIKNKKNISYEENPHTVCCCHANYRMQ